MSKHPHRPRWQTMPALLVNTALTTQVMPVAAQASRETLATTLDTVQVSAQFRAQNLQETPLAISAMTAEMMEARGQFNVLDIASAAPNVTIKPMVGNFGSGAVASIRGVGQDNGSFALEPGVGIYIDDVYYPTLVGSAFELLDLERVEILRGPQGTLAGKNSIGGAIKLYTQVPDEVPGGMLETTVGAFNRRDLRAMGNFILNENSLFLRLSGVSKKRDGYFTRYDYGCRFLEQGFSSSSARGDCVLGHEGGEHYQGIRAALRWLQGQTFEFNLVVDASDADNELPPTRTLVSPDSRFIPDERFLSYSTYEGNGWKASTKSMMTSRGVSAKLDWQPAARHTLTAITSYREYEAGWAIDMDGGPISWYTQQWNAWNHTFSQEIRFNGALGERFDYTVGAYYFDSTSNLEGITDMPGLFAYQDDPVVSTNKPAFTHLMYRLSERWELSAGLRFTAESKQYTFTRLDPGSMLPVNAIHGEIGYYKGNRLDYRLASSWNLGEHTLVYAAYSTGFRGGGINPFPFVPAQVLPFQPEELTAYEIGLKTDLLDRRLRINSALFFNDYKEILVTIGTGFAGFFLSAIPINAGEAEVRGAEVELTAYPLEGLAIDAAYGYLDFKYTKFSEDALASHMDYWMVMRYMSKNKASLGIQYDIPFSPGVLVPRFDVSYYSDFFTETINTELSRVKGATLSNAKLTWQPRNADWEVAAGVNNLFDHYYYHNILDVVTISGVATASPGRPREWFATFRYRF